MVPSVLTPHEKSLPAEISVNVPSGAFDAPRQLSPQQATDPSVLIAQEWYWPVETAVNLPSGVSSGPFRLLPQHSRMPPGLTVHT